MKKYILILVVVWLYAGLPLLGAGFIPTHDGEYHILRIYEFFTMLRAGYIFPRWAPGLNSGYGIPLFNFFYPFPNYVGSFFHAFGFALPDSFKLTLFTGYVAAGGACFLWLKKLFGAKAAFIGSLVFSFVPYWFVDIYIRGSVGEVLAIAFFMMILSSVEYNKKTFIALGVAGLILSHNILAMVFVPFVLVYVFLRQKKLVWSVFWGFLLSAYFWVPALVERQFVTGLNIVNFRDHFPDIIQLIVPSWGTGFSGVGAPFDEMSQQIGLVPLFVFIFSFAVFVREKQQSVRALMVLAFGTVLVSIFFMLPVSQKIWEWARPLGYLQYPWRLLSFMIPTSGLAAAYIVSRTKYTWIFVIIALASVLVTIRYVRPVVYAARGDAYYLSRKEFTDGTSSLGNSFSTIWRSWIPVRAKDKIELIGSQGTVVEYRMKPIDYVFNVQSNKSATVRINTLYYPGWNVMVDGKNTVIDYRNGLIQFPVSGGNHSIRIFFGETLLRLSADVISVVSLAILGAYAILALL